MTIAQKIYEYIVYPALVSLVERSDNDLDDQILEKLDEFIRKQLNL